MTRQQTLETTVTTHGVGLHSGATLPVTLRPAVAGTGVVFRRSDLGGGVDIPALAAVVTDTRMATVLSRDGHSISTVEHLLAALWACGVDNVIVEVGGPEVPVMDGSSAPWVALVERAGVVAQADVRRVAVVRRTVSVSDGDKLAELHPAEGFSVRCDIAFEHPVIGAQTKDVRLDGALFRREFARARTFGFAWEVEALRSAGLARGGSLENAVVLDESGVMNADGLRWADEFVRHKVLDAVGDLFLLGGHVVGRLVLRKSGHALHNRLCRAALESGALQWVPATEVVTRRTTGVVRAPSEPPPVHA